MPGTAVRTVQVTREWRMNVDINSMEGTPLQRWRRRVELRSHLPDLSWILRTIAYKIPLVSTPWFWTESTRASPSHRTPNLKLKARSSRSRDIMKFFSFSKTLVLFAIFTVAQSVPNPQVIPGEFRSYAVACAVDVYHFPSHAAGATSLIPESTRDYVRQVAEPGTK